MSVEPVNGVRADELFERDMFVAHELQRIAPYAVTGRKDQIDGNKNPIYQTVDYASLVPLLWAALREANYRIEALEAANENKGPSVKLEDALQVIALCRTFQQTCIAKNQGFSERK